MMWYGFVGFIVLCIGVGVTIFLAFTEGKKTKPGKISGHPIPERDFQDIMFNGLMCSFFGALFWLPAIPVFTCAFVGWLVAKRIKK